MADLFDDPFYTPSTEDYLEGAFPHIKTADIKYGVNDDLRLKHAIVEPGDEPAELVELINIKAGDNKSLVQKDGEKADAQMGDDAGDIPNAQKQGFFNALMAGLPQAIAVAISKDPGKALINVMEARQQYLIEQERQVMARERQKREDERFEKEFGLKEETLEEEIRQTKELESFREEQLRVTEELKRLTELGLNERHDADLRFRELKLEADVNNAIDNRANDILITKMNNVANMQRDRWKSTFEGNLKVKLANMRTEAERDQWRLDGKQVLMAAGGQPKQSEYLLSIIEATGSTEDLSPEDQALIQRAFNMKITNDETRRDMSAVAKAAAKQAREQRYTLDEMGERVPLPERSEEEVRQFVQSSVSAYASGMGVEVPFYMGDGPQKQVVMTQEQNFNVLKASIEQMDPAQAWKAANLSVSQNFITKEMFDSLGLRDPNPNNYPTGSRVPGAGAMANFEGPLD